MLYYIGDQVSLIGALNNPESDIEIVVTSSFVLSDKVTFPGSKNIVLTTAGEPPYAILRGFSGDMFEIPANSSVTLTDIVIDGNSSSYPDAMGSIFFISGGMPNSSQASLVIGGGAVLRNNRTNHTPGGSNTGGVRVIAGTVRLEDGGIITNNTADSGGGGGIALFGANSLLLMHGGEISHNTGQFGGGVYIDLYAAFDMYSGNVEYNQSVPGGHGGGADAVGAFNMYGGNISYNSSEEGGGLSIHNSGRVNIYQGNFIGNRAAGGNGHGAGILLYESPINNVNIGMTDGQVNFIGNISDGIAGAIGTASRRDLQKLYVGPNVVFANNRSSRGYFMTDPADIELYNSRVQAAQVTEPFRYAYNDFDIQYAAPELSVYTVEFNSNGGSSVPAQTVEEGSTAVQPPAPTRGCDIFDGWYLDAAFTIPWNFAAAVMDDMTLYAKWILNACPPPEPPLPPEQNRTVCFNSNGGSGIACQSITDGAAAIRPADPVRGCDIFLGWVDCDNPSRKWNFSEPVTRDLRLCAVYSRRTCPGQCCRCQCPCRPCRRYNPWRLW
ncbi:MAG: InlB B-repeat-containing protein [Oscillospiraceae bacterium]|jgi:uncharacterized repeat protein (TIGR02543 family)|nr:InlB B-repeat-containing protein [Oscillospiraceae bacterium]